MQLLVPDSIVELVIEALNLFFEIEIGETTTIGELLEDWLDVKLAGMKINISLFVKVLDAIPA